MTPEETAELQALEAEETQRLILAKDEEMRRHLGALRLSKKLAAKHGKPGLDFVVLETKLGCIAIRRPVDVEIDSLDEDRDRATLEKFAASLVLEPTPQDVTKLMSEHHGLVGAIVTHAFGMLKVVREEEAKR